MLYRAGQHRHCRKQLHRHSVFACLEVFRDMQVTQTATVIDPDSRSCVSAKWLWLQLYCISPLGELKSIITCPCYWQAAGSSISVCRLFVCFWPVKNPADRADGPTLCFKWQGRDVSFLFGPPIRNHCHCTSDSLLDFRLKNSSGQKHKSNTGQLICVGIIKITDNQRSVTELQDGCLNSIGLLYHYELNWATKQ
jgi:hypothetical protein